MVRNEACKLIKNPYVWGLLFVCVIINIFFSLYGNKEAYSPRAYKELWQDFLSGGQSVTKEISLAKEEQQKSGENGLEAKEELYTRFLYELNSAQDYDEYRKGILANAKKMRLFSSFSGGSFAKKNVDKTAQHFEQMGPVEITVAPSLGIEKFFSPITAALVLIFLMFVGYLLFIQEGENGIQNLLYVTRYGKTRLFVAKTGAHLLCMTVVTLIMYGTNFFLLNEQYGLGDLSRSIQSVPEYHSCGNILSVGGFLLLATGILLYLFTALTIVIDSLCVWGARTIISVLLFFVCIIVSVFFYLQIPINSSFGWLKYVNPVFCLNVGEAVGKYVNLNLFGSPVSYLPVVIFMYTLVAGICFFLSRIRFCRISSEGKRRITFNKKKHGKVSVAKCHMNLFCYEMFKVRKGGHVAIVFVFFLVLSILFSYQERLIFDDEDEYYYYSYMNELAGMRSEEKSEYIQREKIRFQEIKAEQDKWLSEGQTEAALMLGESLRPYQGFQRAAQREEYLKANKLESFVYEGGYLRLTDLKVKDNQMLLLLGMLVLAFSLCSVFALDKERGQEMLLQTTRYGRRQRTQKKLICSVVLCIASFLIVYVPQFYVFLHLYGLDGVEEPFRCLQLGSWFGMNLPIWLWLVCQYTLRLLLMGLFGGVVLFFSAKLKNVFMTVILMNLAILVLCIYL